MFCFQVFFFILWFLYWSTRCSVSCYSVSTYLWLFSSFLLVSNLSPFWSEKMLDSISLTFNLLRLTLCLNIHSIRRMFQVHWRWMCILLHGWTVLYKSSPSSLIFHLNLLFPCWLPAWFITDISVCLRSYFYCGAVNFSF